MNRRSFLKLLVAVASIAAAPKLSAKKLPRPQFLDSLEGDFTVEFWIKPTPIAPLVDEARVTKGFARYIAPAVSGEWTHYAFIKRDSDYDVLRNGAKLLRDADALEVRQAESVAEQFTDYLKVKT